MFIVNKVNFFLSYLFIFQRFVNMCFNNNKTKNKNKKKTKNIKKIMKKKIK